MLKYGLESSLGAPLGIAQLCFKPRCNAHEATAYTGISWVVKSIVVFHYRSKTPLTFNCGPVTGSSIAGLAPDCRRPAAESVGTRYKSLIMPAALPFLDKRDKKPLRLAENCFLLLLLLLLSKPQNLLIWRSRKKKLRGRRNKTIGAKKEQEEKRRRRSSGKYSRRRKSLPMRPPGG